MHIYRNVKLMNQPFTMNNEHNKSFFEEFGAETMQYYLIFTQNEQGSLQIHSQIIQTVDGVILSMLNTFNLVLGVGTAVSTLFTAFSLPYILVKLV